MHPDYLLTTAELARLMGSNARTVGRIFEPGTLANMGGGRMGISGRQVHDLLAAKGLDYGFKVIAHVNMRGGIGKTITTITAATRAVQYGFRTCILDMDPQASASLAFAQLPGENDPIFYDVWQQSAESTLPALKKIQERFYILPSMLDNALLDLSLQEPQNQRTAVAGVCTQLRRGGFDLVLIDCPPSLNAAVISSICAADLIVIPVAGDAFSFRGLDMTLKEIEAICHAFHRQPPEIKTLLVKYSRREKLSLNAFERLENHYGAYALPMVIRTSTALGRALERQQTVFANTRHSTAREDYDRYVRHILGLDPYFPEKGDRP